MFIPTIESLNNFFVKLLSESNDYYENELKKEELLKLKLGLNIDKVYVKESKIHGNGLFATNTIKAGSIITFYPAHCIRRNINNNGIIGECFSGEKFIVNEDYKIDMCDNRYIVGNPNNTSNMAAVAHIINDSASFDIDNNDTISIKNKVATYILSSKNNAKIEYNDDKTACCIVAVCDIAENDEIFMSYGPSYWLNSKSNLLLFINIMRTDINFRSFILKHASLLY
jgi:SET domain-containing protein